MILCDLLNTIYVNTNVCIKSFDGNTGELNSVFKGKVYDALGHVEDIFKDIWENYVKGITVFGKNGCDSTIYVEVYAD